MLMGIAQQQTNSILSKDLIRANIFIFDSAVEFLYKEYVANHILSFSFLKG
jgi:hypothetical protein